MGSCSAKEKGYLSAADAGFKPPPRTPAGKSDDYFTCDDEESLRNAALVDIPAEPARRHSHGASPCRPSPAGFLNLAPTAKSKPKVLESFHMTSDDKNVDLLRTGASLYYFTCVAGKKLKKDQLDTIQLFVNRSMFKNEATENFSPPVDMFDPAFRNKHLFMLNKACYILPGITSKDVTPDLLSSYWYQENCQSTATTVWKDGEKNWTRQGNTFRITKHIIPILMNITIQFRVSDIAPDVLKDLSPILDGLEVHRGLLLERTKRDGRKSDATKKAKSVYLMHDFKGGVLVANATVGVQSSLPDFVAGIVDTFGGKGAAEVAETCDNTRKFFKQYVKNR